jgi:uncharacterized protein (TIGR03437 family)
VNLMTWLPANSAALILFLTAALPAQGAIEVLAVTSSANFAQGLTQPGSLASVFCTGLQNLSGLVAAEGYPLPRELAGVTVTVNGVEAPILAVANIGGGSYQQINIQVPWEAKAPLIFEVRQEGASARFTPTVNNGWGIFFVDSSENAIAQHASDYRLVTQSDPARSGEWVVVYATNLDYYGLVSGSSGSYQATHIQSNYIGMAPGTMVGQVNLLVRTPFQRRATWYFNSSRFYHCGFFFTPGCGRGFTTVAASMPAKIPVTK